MEKEGEVKMTAGSQSAATGSEIITFKPKRNKAAHLKNFQWKKGQSGNPAGGNRKLLISDNMREVMELPLPDVARAKLEAAIDRKLPKKFTFVDGICLGEALESIGIHVGFKLDIARDIREAIEGRAAQRVELVEESKPVQEGDLSDQIIVGMFDVARRRRELFNLKLPSVDEFDRESAESTKDALVKAENPRK